MNPITVLSSDSKEYKKYSSELPLIALPVFCDETKLVDEFYRLKKPLQHIVLFAGAYSVTEFGMPIVLTHLFRTQAEQDSIYSADPKYQAKKWVSVHQLGRGADIRLKDFGVDKANKLANHINSIFEYRKGSSLKTCLVHDVGQGNHIHLQVE